MQHIWVCTCGKQTECAAEDMRYGAVWHCDDCDTSFACVYPKGGGKAWVEIEPASVKFHRLFEAPEEEEELDD